MRWVLSRLMQTSYNPRPLKQVFNQDNARDHYLEEHSDEVTEEQIEVVEKMLACNTPAAGTFHYACEHEQCGHTKVVYCSCKGRACSACGVKLTEQWIAKQLSIYLTANCSGIVNLAT
jgi:predicted  nucleic acid-binding Zn-ribbon protein